MAMSNPIELLNHLHELQEKGIYEEEKKGLLECIYRVIELRDPREVN